MKHHPLVSIIVPSYNTDCFVGEAIQSALDQTWPNKEILIIDDASTDKSWEVISRFEGPITKTRREKNAGVVENTNELFNRVNGDYICLICCDDALDPTFIEKAMVAYRVQPDLSYVQVHYRPIDSAGKNILPAPAPFYAHAAIVPGSEDARISFLGCHTMLSQHIFSTKAVRQAGGFTGFSGMAYDYELAIKLALMGDVGYIPDALARFRYSDLHLTNYNRTSMLTVFDQYRVRINLLDRKLPKNHPFQKLRPKIVASAAKEAMTYGCWALERGDFPTARRYSGLMVAFNYLDLESPAFNERYEAYLRVLALPDSKVAAAWTQYNEEKAAEAAQNKGSQGGPPHPLPEGSKIIPPEMMQAGLSVWE